MSLHKQLKIFNKEFKDIVAAHNKVVKSLNAFGKVLQSNTVMIQRIIKQLNDKGIITYEELNNPDKDPSEKSQEVNNPGPDGSKNSDSVEDGPAVSDSAINNRTNPEPKATHITQCD